MARCVWITQLNWIGMITEDPAWPCNSKKALLHALCNMAWHTCLFLCRTMHYILCHLQRDNLMPVTNANIYETKWNAKYQDSWIPSSKDTAQLNPEQVIFGLKAGMANWVVILHSVLLKIWCLQMSTFSPSWARRVGCSEPLLPVLGAPSFYEIPTAIPVPPLLIHMPLVMLLDAYLQL